MCLAIPAQVVERSSEDDAVVEMGGVRKAISLALVDGVEVGDWVIVHVGFALERLDPEQAERTLAVFAEAQSSRSELQITGRSGPLPPPAKLGDGSRDGPGRATQDAKAEGRGGG